MNKFKFMNKFNEDMVNILEFSKRVLGFLVREMHAESLKQNFRANFFSVPILLPTRSK